MTDKLENINQINLEFNGSADDDSVIAIKESAEEIVNTNNNKAAVKTGIIINFDDDDELDINIKKHASNKTIEIPKNIEQTFDDINAAKGYNEVDMECKYCDDTEDTYDFVPQTKKSVFDDELDYNEFDDELDYKELAIEDENDDIKKQKKITVDELEDDFWNKASKKFNTNVPDEEKYEDALELEENLQAVNEDNPVSLKNILKDLQKKHSKSIKKGAMGAHFHYVGDAEKSREMFNKGIGKYTELTGDDNSDAGEMSSLIGTGDVGNGDVGASDASAVGGDGGGMGESLQNTNYTSMLKEVFDTIGFDVTKNGNGTLTAKDLYNDSNTITAKNISDLIYALQPFIETCIIIPLSIHTGQTFNSYADWSDWYTDENKTTYPKFANEINYCDLLANHLDECEI